MKLCVLFLTSATLLVAAGWKAGVSATVITPARPIWMAGYSARKQPSAGTLQDIYAKALALQDSSGTRVVLVTTDLLGITKEVAADVAEKVRKQYGLSRDRLMFNSSHTHCGPVIGRMLAVAYNLDAGQWRDIDDYTRELEEKIVLTIGRALHDLHPARISFGHSTAGFARNRRVQFTPDGPVDHDVPILRVDNPSGSIRAVVFGYACHNTTLPPEMCRINGDYAGFAQAELEKKYPRAVALFVMGCGADSNPSPRGTEDIARAHGATLAAAVDRVLAAPLQPVGGPLRAAFEKVSLAFDTPPSREELNRRLQDKNPYIAKHAREMLAILERDGRLPADYPYPIQVWRFGIDLTWIALGGEVVVDYDLQLKKMFGPDRLWVSGYSNDVFAYIPSLRVLKEGGYEGGGAMIYYVQPGPWAPSVESTIISATERMVRGLSLPGAGK
jgi:neutral ceramidase